MSDTESEVDYLVSSQTAASEAVAALPSTVPVVGESFCQCERQEELSPGFGVTGDCLCGEEDQGEQKLLNTVLHHMNTAGFTVNWHKCSIEARHPNITIYSVNLMTEISTYKKTENGKNEVITNKV